MIEDESHDREGLSKKQEISFVESLLDWEIISRVKKTVCEQPRTYIDLQKMAFRNRN